MYVEKYKHLVQFPKGSVIEQRQVPWSCVGLPDLINAQSKTALEDNHTTMTWETCFPAQNN
jgi:hypothetical protein